MKYSKTILKLALSSMCLVGTMGTLVSCDDIAAKDALQIVLPEAAKDPATAEKVVVDRFGDDFAIVFKRSAPLMQPTSGSIPAPGEAIDFDKMFMFKGFGPAGEVISYYHLDATKANKGNNWYSFAKRDGSPVEGQLPVIGVVPGGENYSDFWHIHEITVPDDYQANQISSEAEVKASNLKVGGQADVIHRPIVPEGSSAKMSPDGGAAELKQAWYNGKVTSYLVFEKMEQVTKDNKDHTIRANEGFVLLKNNNLSEGFQVDDSGMTHNVMSELPGDISKYSSLRTLKKIDSSNFDAVKDLASAQAASPASLDDLYYNTPIVK